MSETTVRCPQCGHEGIVITELLDADLRLIADSQQAEIERLRERVAWFEKSGGVTVHTLVHQQRRQLTECRRLLRIVVELHDSIAVREHSIPQEWIEAARAATEE